MVQEAPPKKWTERPRTQFFLGALFLILSIAWLLLPARHTWSYWVPALSWLLLASVWLVRGIKQISAPR
jgi:hypothetical protein